jgi:SAM-dependent methyltransferase
MSVRLDDIGADDPDDDYVESPARDATEVRARHEANRLSWNEGAARYAERHDRYLEFLRSGKSNMHPVERENLGDLRAWCGTAIHLQCASGLDTLSLLNEGAKHVIGIDISEVHIQNAQRLSEAFGASATWYRCDVLDTPRELDARADLVYSGRGAINWIHDLDEWAHVASRLLKSGGVFHLLEDHPFVWLLDLEADEFVFSGNNYFEHGESSKGWPSSTIGELDVPVHEQSRKYEQAWPLSSVFMAVRRAGLTIEYLGEHSDSHWDIFPNMDPEIRRQVPLTFSILARKP